MTKLTTKMSKAWDFRSLKNHKMIFETQRNHKRISCAPKIPKEFFSEQETQSVSKLK